MTFKKERISNTPTLFKVFAFFTLIGITSCQSNSVGMYQEDAINALDEMTQTIGDLRSCSLTVESISGTTENDKTIETKKMSDVYFKGNNRMHVISEQKDKRYGLWYSGEELSWYNFDSKLYDVVDAPLTTLETIDSISSAFNIKFPAADIFYPTFTDDVLANFDTVIQMDNREIDGVMCIEINAFNQNSDVYLLIDETSHLPKQLEIYGLGEKQGTTFISSFSNWRPNSILSDQIFEFSPPEGAEKTDIFKRK